MSDGKVLALDIGGTRIKMGITEKGKILKWNAIAANSHEALRDRLPAVKAALERMMDEPCGSYLGLGIALPCLVDAESRRAVEIYEKFVDAPSIDFAAWAQEAFGLPVVIEQDSKAALIGEAAYGAAQGEKDALLVILGTGVGTAVLLNGRLLDGANHCAGALGSHIRIEMNGRRCTCGGRGCLEAYTSGWALPGLVREQPGFAESALSKADPIDFLALKNAVEAGDAVARQALERIISALRNGLISLIHAYGPGMVVLSGGPVNMGDCFLRPLLEGIDRELWGSCAKVRFEIARHPDTSVLLGMDALVREKRKKEGLG